MLFLTCAIALGAAFVGVANAGPEACPALNGTLNPDQVNAAAKIINQNYAAATQLGQSLAAKEQELRTVLASQAPDKAKIESLSQEIGILRGKLLAVRAEMQNQLRQAGVPVPPNVLPPDPGPGFGPAPAPGPRGPRFHGPHHGNWGVPGQYAPYYPPCMGWWGGPMMWGPAE